MTSDEHSKNKLIFGRLSPDWLSRDFAAGRLRSRLESAVGKPTMPNAQCPTPNAESPLPVLSAKCQSALLNAQSSTPKLQSLSPDPLFGRQKQTWAKTNKL